MAINPAVQVLGAWGSLFALQFGRSIVDGFLSRLFGGRPLQAIGFVVLIVAVTALVGDWLLQRFGRVVDGQVQSKQEIVDIARDGSWTRESRLGVSYTPRGWTSAALVSVPVSPAVYDLAQRRVGAKIRCVPLLPTFCLLRSDSLKDWGIRTLKQALAGGQALFLSGLFVTVFWLGLSEWTPERRLRRWLSRGLFAAWCGVMLYHVAAPEMPAALPDSAPRIRARLHQVQVLGEYTLPQPLLHIPRAAPFAVAELALVPAGARDSVVAVDVVDALNLRGARPGFAYEVQYPVASPRDAQLVGATRRFARRNVSRDVLLTLGLILLLVGPVVIMELLRVPMQAGSSAPPGNLASLPALVASLRRRQA